MQTKDALFAAALASLGLIGPAATPGPALAAPPAAGVSAAPAAGPTVITGFDVTSDASGTHIVLTGSQPFNPDVRSYGSPAATVITVGGRWGAGRAGITPVRKNGVMSVRYGQFADRPQSLVRVVANSRAGLPFTAKPLNTERTRWQVTVWAPGVAPVKDGPAAPAPAPVVSEVPAPATPAVAARPVAFVKPPMPAAAPLAATRVSSVSGGAGPYPGLLKMPVPAVARGEAGRVTAPAAPVAPAAPPMETRQVASARRAAAAPADQDEDLSAGRRVSLDFVAADINDVLKALSLQSGINIVTGNDVKGNVTVSLKRVSLTEALDMVTRLSGFTYAKFGSAYVVGSPTSVGTLTARSDKDVENVTEFIPYRYTSSAVLYRALSDRFPGIKLPEADKNELPSQPRMLVLTDSTKRTTEVREFVSKLEQAASVPTTGAATEVYPVKYASPSELIGILARLVPTVSAQPGPTQGFQPNTLGGSASFSASASPAGGAPAGGGTPGSATPPAGGGASAAAGTGTAPAPNRLPLTLLLTGAPADIARAREILNQIDVRVPQVVFEAKVVDLNDTDRTQLGLTYDFTRGVNIGENNVAPGTANVNGAPGRPVNFGTIFRSPYSIGVQLNAVLNNGRSRLLASPNLAALDGQPATVFIGDQIKYVISIQQTQQGQAIQTETATVGITLKVTGKTSPDGTVTLYVHPEVSTIRDFLQVGGGISLPQISTRFVDTTIRVKDGETIAIGGLIQEQDINNIQKVPFLGDLPFFGKLLFTRQDKQKNRSNLVVFITSRILKD